MKYRKKKPLYDRILMNPPFSKQQDIDHVLHAWKFLKPGGRLVAIMSGGTDYRTNKKAVAFQNLVAEHGHIEPLPEGSFEESGTGVNTVLVVLDK
jgi:16S rRNA G1207 methylase RsmC